MTTDYALGHGEIELKRLETQAGLIDPITLRFFRDAGLVEGMRVMDIGSGVGDVALLAARMVGARGEVVGTDRENAALDVARSRAAALGFGNVVFQSGDPSDMRFDRPFDAVIGRYVLQFVPNASLFLRKLSAHIRPGGIVAFHELDWKGARSAPSVSSYDQCCRWCAETIRKLGAETSMGAMLHQTFIAAGLRPPTMRLESTVAAGKESDEVVHLVTDLVQSLAPEMERLGVADHRTLGLDGLFERVSQDVRNAAATVIGRAEVAAWTNV